MIRENCGSDWGYRLHLKRREPACGPCLEAHRVVWRRSQGLAGTSRQVRPCGTRAAYRRHRRRGETACPQCLLANRTGRDLVTEQAVA